MSIVPDVNQQWSRVQYDRVKNKWKKINLKKIDRCEPTTGSVAPWIYKECQEDTAQ